MRIRTAAIAFALPFVLSIVSAPAAAAAATAPVQRLHALFDTEWERTLREAPVQASGLGDTRYGDRWEDLSLAAIEQQHREDLAALKALAAIPRAALAGDEQLNYDLFQQQYEDRLHSYDFKEYLLPVNHIYGIQSLQDILEVLPFAGAQDYRQWLARLRSFAPLMDQTIVLMRRGIHEGYVQPRVIMQRIPEQISRHIVSDPAQSPYYAPFKQMPDSIPAAEQAALRADAAAAIANVVVPAYQRFQSFFNDEYLPASRDSVGASALPDGAAYYAWTARHHTTTTLSPEQIHAVGLSEVKRIRGEMEAIIQQVGFQGDFDAFSKYLRSEPRFYYKNGSELLTAYQALAKRIDGELPKLFSKLPRLPYGVRAVPDDAAPYQTAAYYQPGAADGSRAGFFYANTYKPETRPIWEMEALTAHEAVPGHHLQIALGQELEALPKFRKFGDGYTAFHEGWGLYAESLGGELGLYRDPYSKYGQLTFEMWRACRLVVDTGLHAKGWSREQAIDFMVANTPRPRHDIENEVDRYIAWPGQALAYKIGQMKITELRERARQALGERFDIRAFHAQVLGAGDIPLDVLERNIDAWIARSRTAT